MSIVFPILYQIAQLQRVGKWNPSISVAKDKLSAAPKAQISVRDRYQNRHRSTALKESDLNVVLFDIGTDLSAISAVR